MTSVSVSVLSADIFYFNQMVDRLVVQVQDAVKALSMGDTDAFQSDIDQASSVVKDADNSKQVKETMSKVLKHKRLSFETFLNFKVLVMISDNTLKDCSFISRIWHHNISETFTVASFIGNSTCIWNTWMERMLRWYD